MEFLKKWFGKKKNKESTIPVSKLLEKHLGNHSTIIYSSEIPEYTSIGNLNYHKRYNEAIELGEKLLIENPESGGSHINLMVSYFKIRDESLENLELSSYHAKQAIICGHNTGYAHQRLVINLEKSGKIRQAIELCDIVLSENYHFSSHGCGRKEDFLVRKERLQRKLNKIDDPNYESLFTENEIKLLHDNI